MSLLKLRDDFDQKAEQRAVKRTKPNQGLSCPEWQFQWCDRLEPKLHSPPPNCFSSGAWCRGCQICQWWALGLFNKQTPLTDLTDSNWSIQGLMWNIFKLRQELLHLFDKLISFLGLRNGTPVLDQQLESVWIFTHADAALTQYLLQITTTWLMWLRASGGDHLH